MATKKRAPDNTTREVRENPLGFLADLMGCGNNEAVAAQESRGQRSFVQSETLPTDISAKDKAVLKLAGVKFLGKVEDDDKFQYVELPAGWKKEPTDHAMWTNLLDQKGRKRAAIFYKAAFYDRSARLSLNCRYSFELDYDRANDKNAPAAVAHVKDGNSVIFSTKPIKLSTKRDDAYYDACDRAKASAAEWLKKKFPESADPGAYWD